MTYTIDAKTAEKWNMVNMVVPADQLMAEAMKAADAAGDQNHFDKLYKEMEQDAINVDQFTKELRKNMLKHAHREMPKVKGPRDFNYKERLEQWRYNRKDAQDWLRRH